MFFNEFLTVCAMDLQQAPQAQELSLCEREAPLFIYLSLRRRQLSEREGSLSLSQAGRAFSQTELCLSLSLSQMRLPLPLSRWPSHRGSSVYLSSGESSPSISHRTCSPYSIWIVIVKTRSLHSMWIVKTRCPYCRGVVMTRPFYSTQIIKTRYLCFTWSVRD